MQYRKEYIMINKEFIADNSLYEHKEHFVYTLLCAVRNDLTNTTIISIDMIAEILGLSLHTKNRAVVKDVLSSMEEKGLITLYKDMLSTQTMLASDMKVSSSYSVFVHEPKSEEDYFSIVEFEYLNKFIAMKEKNKELSFAIFMNLISRLYNNESSRKYTFPNIDTIEKETGIDKKTITKHINRMKENEIIYYETARISYSKEKNIYSKWHNRKYVSTAVRRVESGESIEEL